MSRNFSDPARRKHVTRSFPSTKVCLGVSVLLLACGKEENKVIPSPVIATTSEAPRQTAGATPGLPCGSPANVVCFHTNAYSHEEPDVANPVLGAHWIWFGTASDSIEISARPDLRSPQTGGGTYISTSLGQERDSLGNTASHFRRRLASDGVVELSVTFDNIIGSEIMGDTVGYTLTIGHAAEVSRPALRTTGKWATLTIVSARATDAFSVVPISIVSSVRDFSKWKVSPRTYNVALTADSLYEVCRLPCSSPDTITLTPSATVSRTFRGR